eukprot:jgi/Bigna1/89021/estExt_fgenesh1_pg.C_420103
MCWSLEVSASSAAFGTMASIVLWMRNTRRDRLSAIWLFSYTVTQYVDVILWLDVAANPKASIDDGHQLCTRMNHLLSQYVIPLDVIWQCSFEGGRDVKPGWTLMSLIMNRGVVLRAVFFTSLFYFFWPYPACSHLQHDAFGREFISWANFEVPFWAAGLVPLTGMVHSVVTKTLTVRKLVVWTVFLLQMCLHGRFLMNTWCLYCFALFPFMWIHMTEYNVLEKYKTA